MIDVMLDLETWGTEPGCDLRSIGACVFDPVTGWVAGTDFDPRPYNETEEDALAREMHEQGEREQQFYIATDNPTGYWGTGSSRDRFFETGNPSDRRRYALSRDPRTVQWWSEQSDEAKSAFSNPVELRIALSRLAVWLADVCPDVTALRLWSHGPAFDPPILAAAYKAVNLPVPWHYRAPRDTRTAFDMAGIVDHSDWLRQHSGDDRVAHHALSDAICQARAVCGAYQKNRSETVDAQGKRWALVDIPRHLFLSENVRIEPK